MTQPVEQALDEPQERQLEQEEADVAVEDRVGDRAPSAENGTRWIQSRTVSQADETEAPMMIATMIAIPARAPPASGVRSGTSLEAKVMTGAVSRP